MCSVSVLTLHAHPRQMEIMYSHELSIMIVLTVQYCIRLSDIYPRDELERDSSSICMLALKAWGDLPQFNCYIITLSDSLSIIVLLAYRGGLPLRWQLLQPLWRIKVHTHSLWYLVQIITLPSSFMVLIPSCHCLNEDNWRDTSKVQGALTVSTALL